MDTARAGPGLSHHALLYHHRREYLTCIVSVVRAGLAAGEPVLIAVPGDRGRLVREHLNADSSRVARADMAETGRNPARIIGQIAAFADRHAGRRIRVIQEPAWPGRTPAELHEVTRHEALLNLALAGGDVSILCLFDAGRLDGPVIGGAQRTHPAVIANGRLQPSASFAGGERVPPEYDRPLPAPPAGAKTLSYRAELRPVRQLVEGYADRCGLSGDRAASLVLAASELAANTLRHTSTEGTMHIWHSGREVLCQVRDQGWITDPLAGLRKRPADLPGHGLWVVNQVCDLVEMRTGPAGTTIRLHMLLTPG